MIANNRNLVMISVFRNFFQALGGYLTIFRAASSYMRLKITNQREGIGREIEGPVLLMFIRVHSWILLGSWYSL